MNHSLLGKTIIDKLEMDFELINIFRTICTQLPLISYVDNVELRVLEKINGYSRISICRPMEDDREIWKDKV